MGTRSRSEDVLRAFERRAVALVDADERALRRLLHPEFVWTSHSGERFDLAAYLRANVDGRLRWLRQELHDPRVIVVGDVAVVTGVVSDTVVRGSAPVTFVMPLTQTWVADDGGWRCLAGHAGPLLERSADAPAQ